MNSKACELHLNKIIIKKFNAIPILLPAVFRVEIDKLNIKFIEKRKGPINKWSVCVGRETKLGRKI